MSLELYKGRNSPHDVAAHHEDTRARLAATARLVAGHAEAILAAHHGRTQTRFNNSVPPTIKLEHGHLDWYVILDAGGDLDRAIGIEYGHRPQSRRTNGRDWGQSKGIGALRRAADAAAASGVFD